MMLAVAALGLAFSPMAAHATEALTAPGQARAQNTHCNMLHAGADASPDSNLTPAWDPLQGFGRRAADGELAGSRAPPLGQSGGHGRAAGTGQQPLEAAGQD
jgi:hypothetical protein